MEKTDFYYYLHKTKITDSAMIEDIFNNGLTSWYGTSIHSTIYPIDEKLKDTNPLEWVSLMNNYKYCAEEIIFSEYIYV